MEGETEYYNGVCLICGDEQEDDSAYLFLRQMELCPSLFESPIILKNLAICVGCFDKLTSHLVYNARYQGRVKVRR